jgi:hypothetical protein
VTGMLGKEREGPTLALSKYSYDVISSEVCIEPEASTVVTGMLGKEREGPTLALSKYSYDVISSEAWIQT